MFPSITALPWLPAPPDDFLERCGALPEASPSPGEAVAFLASHRLSPQQALALSRAMNRCRSDGRTLAPLSPFRLGVLASATYDLVNDCIPAAAARHGVAAELVTAPYDQVMQQALDMNSDVNRAHCDAVLIAVDHRWLKLDRAVAAGQADTRVAEAVGHLRAIVEGLRAHGGSPAILQTVATPPQALFGSYDRRVRDTPRSMIEEANGAIVRLAEETGSYLLDVAALAERIGTDRWFDPIQWAAYKLPFAAECFSIYADVLGRLLGAIRGKARKCLVLDLDNTVWGGVIGDDGLEGICIGQGNPVGESFLSVQQCALDLRGRGIVLAVCSKNSDETARRPFRERPEMLLREEHFAVFQANWTDKPSNLEAVAHALNLGLDALVVLDDNPAERAEIRAALPTVAVPELPRDPSWFAWYLTAAGYFETVTFSAEDAGRAESYASDARRAEVKAATRDLGDYLASLGMSLRFAPFDARDRGRIVQLINKTNQFNLTTRRYSELEVQALESDPAAFTCQVRLADRFGDLGMIAVVICRQTGNAWDIDTWLMSCRVLGRRVEEAVLAHLVEAAKTRGIRRLVGTWRPTAKNAIVADHYAKLGFLPLDEDESGTRRFELRVDTFQPGTLPFRTEAPSAINSIAK
jgi:FkbH-like protein